MTINGIEYEIRQAPKPEPEILYANQPPEDDSVYASGDYSRYRPMCGGIQLYAAPGTGRNIIGTLGCFVKKNKDIYNYISPTSELCPVESLDAAIAKVDDTSIVAKGIIQEIGNIDSVQAVGEELLGQKVIKRGRTTRLTEGIVEALSVRWLLDSGRISRENICVRSDIKNPFSDSSDSGSVVLCKEKKMLVGLHHSGGTAGDIKFSYASYMTDIFDCLQLELP